MFLTEVAQRMIAELRKSLETAHQEELYHRERADTWKAVAHDQAARIRELEGTLQAERDLAIQLRRAVDTMGDRILELEAALRREEAS